MDWRWGLSGALSFGIGGFFLLLAIDAHFGGGSQLEAMRNIFGFVGFLLLGLGLLLIVRGTKEKPNS